MDPSYKGDYNENVKQSQRNIIASRRYCNMRVALLPQQPRMSVWLEIIAYRPLSVPSAPAPTTQTTPITAPDAIAPQQPTALPLGTSPAPSSLPGNTWEQGTAKPMPGHTSTLVEPSAPTIASAPTATAPPTPIESLIGQPPTPAPQGLIESLAPGAQRKLIANLNTRARPSTNSALVYEIQPNTAVVITSLVENGDWAAVSVQGKPVGFVRTTALERNSGAPTLGAANPVGVAEALANPQGWPAVIPGPVATVINERRKKCREANQAMNSGQLLQADIDGDGAADFIVDDSNGCSAVQSLFCGATGSCSAQLFFSSREFRDSGTLLHRGISIRPGRGNAMDIVASLSGSECNRANYEPCEKRFRWTGRTLAEVQAR